VYALNNLYICQLLHISSPVICGLFHDECEFQDFDAAAPIPYSSYLQHVGAHLWNSEYSNQGIMVQRIETAARVWHISSTKQIVWNGKVYEQSA
jgi:hypothetical protein